MPFDLMQYVDEEIEERSGGGSFICQFSIGAGYLVFATGDRVNRYFEVSPKTNRDKQKELANELAAKSGVDAKGKPKRSNFVLSLYLYADSVLNRDETPTWKQAGPGIWGHDLAVWGSAYKEVLAPSILETLGENFDSYTKYWGQVDLVPDPYNATSGKDYKVPQIVQVFESEDDARKAVEDSGGTVAPKLPDMPEKFNEVVMGSWNIYVQDVLNTIESGGDGTDFLSAENGFTIDDYMAVLKYHEETNKEEEIPF